MLYFRAASIARLLPFNSETQMPDITPVDISRHGNEIRIQWSDGSHRAYAPAKLRAACPCATCREKHGPREGEVSNKPALLPVLSLAEARPVTIEKMRPVGNYAYNIAFSDGHDSGLFTFDYLYSIGTE